MTTTQLDRDEIVSTREAASRLGIPVSTICTWHFRKKLNAVGREPTGGRGNHTNLFRLGDIIELAQRHRITPTEGT